MARHALSSVACLVVCLRVFKESSKDFKLETTVRLCVRKFYENVNNRETSLHHECY